MSSPTKREDEPIESNLEVQQPSTNVLPSARLAAVTRKKNEITVLINNSNTDKEIVRAQYTEYLGRVDNLLAACNDIGDIALNWLAPHAAEINIFRASMGKLLNPKSTVQPRSRVSENYSISTTSSARARIAEQRAALQAKREMYQQSVSLEKEEMKLKQQQQYELFKLKFKQQEEAMDITHKRRQLEVDTAECTLELLLEEEIKTSSCSSVSSIGQNVNTQEFQQHAANSNRKAATSVNLMNPISPPRQRLASPPRQRLASPPCQRLASPPRQRLASPPRQRLASPLVSA